MSRFNRTFMELKLKKLLLFLLLSISFQSYLYGIEILEQILKDQHHQRVSIVPLWNWNHGFVKRILLILQVSIVPLWNWNTWEVVQIRCNTNSFNRTFMELKSDSKSYYYAVGSGFNRTFMELKCDESFTNLGCDRGFNRTFMELK